MQNELLPIENFKHQRALNQYRKTPDITSYTITQEQYYSWLIYN